MLLARTRARMLPPAVMNSVMRSIMTVMDLSMRTRSAHAMVTQRVMEALRALEGSEFAKMAIDRVTALERSGWNVKSGWVLKRSDVTIKIMTVMDKWMRTFLPLARSVL